MPTAYFREKTHPDDPNKLLWPAKQNIFKNIYLFMYNHVHLIRFPVIYFFTTPRDK